jgi:hypothetical protein
VTEDVIDLDGERPTTGANEPIAPEHQQPSTPVRASEAGSHTDIAASELRVSQKEFVCVGSVTPHKLGRTHSPTHWKGPSPSKVAVFVHSRGGRAGRATARGARPNELRGPLSELVRQVVVELVREQLNGDAPNSDRNRDTPAVYNRTTLRQSERFSSTRPKVIVAIRLRRILARWAS